MSHDDRCLTCSHPVLAHVSDPDGCTYCLNGTPCTLTKVGVLYALLEAERSKTAKVLELGKQLATDPPVYNEVGSAHEQRIRTGVELLVLLGER